MHGIAGFSAPPLQSRLQGELCHDGGHHIGLVIHRVPVVHFMQVWVEDSVVLELRKGNAVPGAGHAGYICCLCLELDAVDLRGSDVLSGTPGISGTPGGLACVGTPGISRVASTPGVSSSSSMTS